MEIIAINFYKFMTTTKIEVAHALMILEFDLIFSLLLLQLNFFQFSFYDPVFNVMTPCINAIRYKTYM